MHSIEMQVSFHGSIIKGFFENLTKKESLACIACFYLTTPCCHLSVHRICLQLYWEMPQAPTNRFLDRLNLRYTFPTNRLLTNRQCHADQRLVHVEDLALCRLTPQCQFSGDMTLYTYTGIYRLSGESCKTRSTGHTCLSRTHEQRQRPCLDSCCMRQGCIGQGFPNLDCKICIAGGFRACIIAVTSN